jgi:hypothetical protein
LVYKFTRIYLSFGLPVKRMDIEFVSGKIYKIMPAKYNGHCEELATTQSASALSKFNLKLFFEIATPVFAGLAMTDK